jgi:acyl-CoA thioesterase FadM
MASLTIDFLHEVRVGELVLVKGAITRVGTKSFSHEMRLYEADSMRHCATQKATEVCFDTKKRQGVALPEDIAASLRAIAISAK